MLLRSRFACPFYINVSKRLLSTEVREVLSTRLDPPGGTIGNQIQLATVTKNLNAVNFDLYVNNLGQDEDRSSEIIDLLARLRSTKCANSILESTHFAVIRHLLENLTMQELIPILVDRPKYGVFLNNFTAFAVTQILHEEKEYILSLPLALKLVLLDGINSEFVQGFCVKAALESLKKECLEEQIQKEDKNKSSPKGKVQEIKVRVQFIRNITEPDVHKEIGKAFLRIKPKVFENNTRASAEILSFVLTKSYAELEHALNEKSVEINEDIGEICKKLLLHENQTGFVNKIEKLQTKLSFETSIDELLKKSSEKDGVGLAAKQKQLWPIWQELRAQKKIEMDNEIAKKDRKDNIEEMTKEIATKKELLWFFDNEDKLDLEIFKKQVFYPKSGFGKKKKPRVVDEHYVPPDIRRIN